MASANCNILDECYSRVRVPFEWSQLKYFGEKSRTHDFSTEILCTLRQIKYFNSFHTRFFIITIVYPLFALEWVSELESVSVSVSE